MSGATVDSGVDSEVSPSSPDSNHNNDKSPDDNVAADVMETAETLLALSSASKKAKTVEVEEEDEEEEDDSKILQECLRRGDTAVVFPQHPEVRNDKGKEGVIVSSSLQPT